jgi:hypothetical protein
MAYSILMDGKVLTAPVFALPPVSIVAETKLSRRHRLSLVTSVSRESTSISQTLCASIASLATGRSTITMTRNKTRAVTN